MNYFLRIGTRGSALALAQARWTQQAIESHTSRPTAKLVTITTSGDRFVDRSLSSIGGKGLFVKEIEEALRDRRIDCAVHSMKDLPGELAPGLTIAAVPARADARDVALTRGGAPLAALPAGARVGTSSLRRMALIHALHPTLDVVSLRGNVDTRLRKFDAGEFDAIILAAAGLQRLGLTRADAQPLDPRLFVPAVGQGALAIETRADDVPDEVAALDHASTRIATDAERAFLRHIGGSCHTPLAAYATIDGDQLHLAAMIASPDGERVLRSERRGTTREAAALGVALADELLARGGADILRALQTNA
ncbi:MAG: hydroxymethylbilane synthase [Deltaproteobacteria bacterium]|nr:hydroxymethylbilane synthase [Deltaproteobacteria bacterium]MBI3386441.1 hydroxymethylbilane synthase [Deltaproteobacteria bacterium]